MEIREVLADDWPAIAALLAELGRPDVRGRDGEDEHRAGFVSYLSRPDAVALAAVDGGAVVGFIDLEFRARLNFLTPQAWVPDLIVTSSATKPRRRQGAARSRRGAGPGARLLRALARVGDVARAGACVLRARGDDAHVRVVREAPRRHGGLAAPSPRRGLS